MKGYSKNSVLAMMTALGTSVFMANIATAQQYNPVNVNGNVQVNWDVADGYGEQPTVPQYLSPSVPREHIATPGGDLIYPETRPHSEFLAKDRFHGGWSNSGAPDTDFETVVIDGAAQGQFPSKSEFYGVPGVPNRMSPQNTDGANRTITLRPPAPATAPRSKPATPARTPSSGATSNTPTQLTKAPPAPAPAKTVETSAAPAAEKTVSAKATPAPVPAPAAPEQKSAMAPPPETPPLPDAPTKIPAAPAIDPAKTSSDTGVSPAPQPDTTASPKEMVTAAPAPTPAPAREEASIPPSASEAAPSAPAGSGEYSLGFAAESFELTSAARSQLDQIVQSMGRDENMRIQLQAYAQGDGANASKARRLSLSRALQVRSYLIDNGVRSTRIDVRALGANVPSGPADRVDIKTVQR